MILDLQGRLFIAPKLGMFTKTIRDGETGFLYNGTIDDLARVFEQISKKDTSELYKIGESCFNQHKHLTVSSTSKKLFMHLQSLL